MKTYTLLRRLETSDNTSATGHGDFLRVSWKTVLTVGAESPAKARASFKKMFGQHISFSGQFAPYGLQEKK